MIAVTNNFNPVNASSTQTSKPAAPYTKQAAENLTDLLNEQGLPPAPVKQKITSSDMLETYINYYIKIWGMAGYDFRKSMDKYVHDMNVNPNALAMPPIYDYTAPEILGYTTIQNFYQGNQDELILKKYFSQETINSFDKSLKKAQSGTSKYWFPQGMNTNKLTAEQKASYKILSENEYKYNHAKFVQQKVKEARMQGRPVIQKDLGDVARDQNILKSINLTLHSNFGVDINSMQYGTLNQSQITELNRIVNEYGIDALSDVGIQQRIIAKYLYTQSYNNTQNKASDTYQTQPTTTNQINDAPDRADIMRFYNGNGYYSPTSDTIKKVVVPGAINKFMDYASGLINY